MNETLKTCVNDLKKICSAMSAPPPSYECAIGLVEDDRDIPESRISCYHKTIGVIIIMLVLFVLYTKIPDVCTCNVYFANSLTSFCNHFRSANVTNCSQTGQFVNSKFSTFEAKL